MEACGTGVQLISKVGSINTWEFSEPLYPPGSRWTGDCQEVIRVDAPESLEVLHVYLHAALKTEQDQLGHWKARLFKYYQCERALWDSACHRFQPQYRLKQIEGIFQKIKRGLKVAKKGVVSISAVRRLGQGCDSLNR